MGRIVPFKKPAKRRLERLARRAPRSSFWRLRLIICGLLLIGLAALQFGYVKTVPSSIEVVDVADKGTVDRPHTQTVQGNIAPGTIQVIDGDTITIRGQTVRLVGFDTPEAGLNAQCETERSLAARATARLRQLVASGDLDLSLIRCSCPPGTEGTQACNYGRSCGVLKATGRDVGDVLIMEGLAKPYLCSGTRCPRRKPWC